MKKNYLFAIGLLCAIAGMTACSESEVTPDYSTPAGDAIAFNCSYSWGVGNEMIWSDKIQVGLFCEQSGSANVPLGVTALTANETLGSFYTKTKWGEGEYKFNLYAPYKKENTTTKLAGAILVTQSQAGVSTAHIDQNALIYASVKATKTDTPVDVAFKQVLNYLDVSMTTASTWSDWTIDQLTIKAPEGMDLAGSYTFDLATGDFAFGADKKDSVALNISGVTLSNAAAFHAYLMTAPFKTTSNVECKATVTVTKSGTKPKTKRLTGKLVIPSGVAGNQLVAISIDLDKFVAEELEDTSIDLCDPNDTGTPVTANCYVVGAPGQIYRFDATVMGNGYTTPAIDGNATAPGITPTTLAPKSAKLLWQTSAQLISAVKLSNNQVYFTVNGTLNTPSTLIEGNAVVAVYSGENGTGNILWSWHIWVTNADLNAKVQTYQIHSDYSEYGNLVDPVMMDRNLGATTTGYWAYNNNNNATGLSYQWGRKDPFPGPGSGINAVTYATTYDSEGQAISAMASGADFTNAVAWTVVNKMVAKDDVAKYPMCFVARGKGNAAWLDDAASDLWGNPLGGAPEANDIGRKSIYDPCPPGYRMPHAYVWSGFTDKPKGGTIGATDASKIIPKLVKPGIVDLASWNANIVPDGGCEFLVNGVTIQYPFNGFINYENLAAPYANVGKRIDVWAAAPSGANGSMFYAGDRNINLKGNGRSWGYTVRCMKEK